MNIDQDKYRVLQAVCVELRRDQARLELAVNEYEDYLLRKGLSKDYELYLHKNK